MKQKEKVESWSREVYETLRVLIRTILAMLLVFTLAFRLSLVRGRSMEPTLLERDLLLVLSGTLCGDYAPGDVVILQRESLQLSQIVKRVIATEGQVVDIDFSTGAVYVDGQRLQEDYINEPTYRQEGVEFPLRVPEGCVFVMGDNRNHSTDSRDPRLGTVDTRYIIGKAVLLLFPGKTETSGPRDFGRIGGIG